MGRISPACGTGLTRVNLQGSDGMAIFLAILKWIGIVLGGLLGLVLLLAVLIMCVPVCYQISGNNRDVICYQYRVSWLFRFLSVKKRLDSDEVWFRIAGIPVACLAGRKNQRRKEKKGKGNRPKDEIVSPAGKDAGTKKAAEEISGPSGEKAEDRGPDAQAETGKEQRRRRRFRKKRSKKRKAKKTFSFDRVSSIIKFVRADETRYAIRTAQKELGGLIRYLSPRKVKGQLVIGTGDPSSTGLLIGGLSLFPFVYQEGISVTPDFDEKILQAEGMIRGRIQVLYFVKLCIRLYRDRELRKMWNKIQKLKKEAA